MKQFYLSISLILIIYIPKINASTLEAKIQPVKKNDDIFLSCEIGGEFNKLGISLISNRVVGVRWKKNKETIYTELNGIEVVSESLKNRLQIHDRSTLRITNVTIADRGLYTCSVDMQNFSNRRDSNDLQTNFKTLDLVKIFLDVREKPSIVSHSNETLLVNRGTDQTLFCQVTGIPRPSVVWLFNEELFKDRVFSDRSSRLSYINVTNVQEEHVGIYECVAKNSEDKANAKMKLLIKNPLLFSKFPVNQTVFENTDSVTFPCTVDTNYNGHMLIYEWFKENTHLTTYKIRDAVTNDGSLVLKNITKENTGSYTCQVTSTNVLNGEVKKTAFLNVLYKPISFVPITPINMNLNDVGRIPCMIDTNPSVDLVQWKHQRTYETDLTANGYQTESRNFSVSPADLQVLSFSPEKKNKFSYIHEIKSVNRLDSGLYSCRGKNALGWGNWSEQIEIRVIEYPYFTEKPESLYFAKRNGQLKIRCIADGDPKPTVFWKRIRQKSRSEINTDASLHQKKLMLNLVENLKNENNSLNTSLWSGHNSLFNGVYEISDSFQNKFSQSGLEVIESETLVIENMDDATFTDIYACIAKNTFAAIVQNVKIVEVNSQNKVMSDDRIILEAEGAYQSLYVRWTTSPTILSAERKCNGLLKFKFLKSSLLDDWESIPLSSTDLKESHQWIFGLVQSEVYIVQLVLNCLKAYQKSEVFVQFKSLPIAAHIKDAGNLTLKSTEASFLSEENEMQVIFVSKVDRDSVKINWTKTENLNWSRLEYFFSDRPLVRRRLKPTRNNFIIFPRVKDVECPNQWNHSKLIIEINLFRTYGLMNASGNSLSLQPPDSCEIFSALENIYRMNVQDSMKNLKDCLYEYDSLEKDEKLTENMIMYDEKYGTKNSYADIEKVDHLKNSKNILNLTIFGKYEILFIIGSLVVLTAISILVIFIKLRKQRQRSMRNRLRTNKSFYNNDLMNIEMSPIRCLDQRSPESVQRRTENELDQNNANLLIANKSEFILDPNIRLVCLNNQTAIPILSEVDSNDNLPSFTCYEPQFLTFEGHIT